ncbi:MAG: hypothetical protein QM668_21985 [Agriterribacter sp.]
MDHGRLKKQNQVLQDKMLNQFIKGIVWRAVRKSKAVYQNKNWDLVDIAKENNAALDEIKDEELPAEFKGKSKQR